MKTKNLLLLLVLMYSESLTAQTPDSVKSFIDSALYFMEKKSLNGKGLNWDQIRDSAYLKAEGAKSYNEAFPAIAYAFRQLKDYHGVVATKVR